MTAGADYFWFGLNDLDQSKGWQFTDGAPVPYFNWKDGKLRFVAKNIKLKILLHVYM